MAKTPWAIIKLCLPRWVVESSPHKQAFVLFLFILSPSLLLSPFLLSPLLTLLLLTSATAAGALSAWMCIKVTRMVLKSSSPLCLHLNPASFLDSIMYTVKLQILQPFVITSKISWAWTYFIRVLTSSEMKEIVPNDTEVSVSISSIKDVQHCSSGEREEDAAEVEKKSSEDVEHSLGSKTASDFEILEVQTSEEETSLESPAKKEEMMFPSKGRGGMEEVQKFKLSEFGRGGSGSVYFRGAALGAKILKAKRDFIGASLSFASKNFAGESESNQKDKKLEKDPTEVSEEWEILTGYSESKDGVNGNDDPMLPHPRLIRYPRTTDSEESVIFGDVGLAEELQQRIVIEKTECSSHVWCTKGAHLKDELELLVQDIHLICLGKWYPSLSSNEAFPAELKILLDMCVSHASSIGSRFDITCLAQKLASLFLCHLREFRKARRKKRAAESVTPSGNKDGESKSVLSMGSLSEKSVQSAARNGSPHKDVKSSIVEENLPKSPPEKVTEERTDKALLQTETSQFVSSTPKTHVHTPFSKQELAQSPPPKEEFFYRLKFGRSKSFKGVPHHYLINMSTCLVREFVCSIGQLPADASFKHYFRDFGSSVLDSSPGKVLVSMIAFKILLPLVETISEPEWLNTRIINLLVEHAEAKVNLDDEDKGIQSQQLHLSHHVMKEEEAISDEETSSCAPQSSSPSKTMGRLCSDSGSREERRKSLSLPLEMGSNNSGATNPIDGRISSVLGGIISATAGPLLPDNVGVSYKPIKRMWSSPSVEEEFAGGEQKIPGKPFGRSIVDGLPVETRSVLHESPSESVEEVLCLNFDKSQTLMSPATEAKDLERALKNKPALSAKKLPTNLLGLPFGSQQTTRALTRSGLFRSKSSHDVQAVTEEIWHVEEGSELHEDIYLSDDTSSPSLQEKESRECSSRKPGRSRSFHGTKSYKKQGEGSKDYTFKEPGVPEFGKGSSIQVNGSKSSFKSEKTILRVFSEGSMREKCNKAFQERSITFHKDLDSKLTIPDKKGFSRSSDCMDSDERNRLTSGLLCSMEKVEKSSFLSSEGSMSEVSFSPDVFKSDVKFSDAKVLGKEESKESHLFKDKPDEGTEAIDVYHSSPLPSATGLEEGIKDISPVYEEVEDLPSTIAKLKALLKERNGSRQSEESPSEEKKNDNPQEEVNVVGMDHQESGEDVQCSPLEERPFSWPSDGGIFLNVRIPYTEISKGSLATSLSSSSSSHVFYCIEYDAVYPEEGADATVVGLVSEEGTTGTGGLHSYTGEKGDDATEAPSPGNTVHHLIVKRRFQEFLDLQSQLEADPLWRQALKGLKGPSKWLYLPFGKTSASTVAGRRTLLQAYLRGVCTSMPQLASRSKALKEFMSYQGVLKPSSALGEALPASVERVLPLAAEGGDAPVQRIDKFFARTVSGMFNTIKTALPGFDSPETTQISSAAQVSSSSSTPLPTALNSSHLDSSSAPATLGEGKPFLGQHTSTIRGMQLPAFLQFGNNSSVTCPELVDWDMEYLERDPGSSFTASGNMEGLLIKNFNLEEDVQSFFERMDKSSDIKADTAEFAYEALNSYDSFEEKKDQSLPSSLQKDFRGHYAMDSVDEDGEDEELDALLPLTRITIDILCESLRGTGCWISQGTVVHASKVLIGPTIEQKLEDFLKAITTEDMWRHYVHILRVALFHHSPPNSPKNKASRRNDEDNISGLQLASAIYTAFPLFFRQIVGKKELLEAAKFIAESLQNKIILRELVLQVLHVFIVDLISTKNNSKE